MKYEHEITVEIDCSLDELKNILNENNFKIVDEYELSDIYMIRKDKMDESDKLELLKNCVLIRNIIEEDKNSKKITYKYKEYNEQKEIIKQGKVDCTITSIEEAKKLLEAIDYQEFIKLYDHLIVYSNEDDELAIQIVNNKHIYIEVEEFCNRINKKYSNIEEMKGVFKKYNIPIKNNDYFVKKAEVEISERYNK